MEDPTHPLHHSDRPRRERKAIPARAGFFSWRIGRPQNGAAITLSEAMAQFDNP